MSEIYPCPWDICLVDPADAALAQVSSRLLRHLADRVSSTESGGLSVLRLHFEH